LQGLCAAVLAGGNSSRMGIDKAFLKVGNKYFIQIITRELNKITDRIVVVIGEKEPMQFKNILGKEYTCNQRYVQIIKPDWRDDKCIRIFCR